MKFTCQRGELSSSLLINSKAFASNPNNPIISGLYIEAKENGIIELRSTDNEIGIVMEIKGEVETWGSVIVLGKYFQDIIRSLPGDEVTITSFYEEGKVNITSGSASFDIFSLKGDFPEVRMKENRMSFMIKDTLLKSMIKKTAFACSNDEKRPVFTGCLLEIEENKINMVGTNTHRLSLISTEISENLKKTSVIVPAKVLVELSRIMNSDIPEDIEIAFTDSRVSFTFENIHITSRIIEGQFPNYRNVIPLDFKTRVEVNRLEFLSAIERVSLIARHDDYKITHFNFSESEIKMTSSSNEAGYAAEKVKAVLDGENIAISFNYTYLVDALKNMESDIIYLSLNERLSPASIREPKNEDFIYIITPVKSREF